VAAVGPTCAGALESFGVSPKVVPENPKMGPMVAGLARYLERKRIDSKKESRTIK
jgi:uroporphyrinogen-III synthase